MIEQGDLITLDFGCYYQGYVSDMTRTFAVGDPGDKLKEIYQIVLEAQEKVLAAAKPGMTGIELDAIARDHIASFGYGDAFGHSTGHGIGLEITKDQMYPSALIKHLLSETSLQMNQGSIFQELAAFVSKMIF